MTEAYMDGRDNHLIRLQPVHEHRYRCYVSDGIHRADFMEMYLRDRHAMHMALSFRDK